MDYRTPIWKQLIMIGTVTETHTDDQIWIKDM